MIVEYNYYLRKADNLCLNISEEVDETMASGRQFQSAIVLGNNEILKMSLLAYGTRNLNWWLPLVRLSGWWIKYFRLSISIRPWVSLYTSVSLNCLLLVSSVAHPKSLIMSVLKTRITVVNLWAEPWHFIYSKRDILSKVFHQKSANEIKTFINIHVVFIPASCFVDDSITAEQDIHHYRLAVHTIPSTSSDSSDSE